VTSPSVAIVPTQEPSTGASSGARVKQAAMSNTSPVERKRRSFMGSILIADRHRVAITAPQYSHEEARCVSSISVRRRLIVDSERLDEAVANRLLLAGFLVGAQRVDEVPVGVAPRGPVHVPGEQALAVG